MDFFENTDEKQEERGERRGVPEAHLASALTDFSLSPIEPEVT
jgi:hypothetical protein